MELDLGNITIHYQMIGEGKPILMLHGQPLDHRSMLGCMEPIFSDRTGWQRIYLDLPGMGKTKGADWIENQDQVLDVVLAFVDQLIPQTSYAVAGSSYGGYLAQGMAYRRPEQINGLLLLVPSCHVERDKRRLPSKVTLYKDSAFLSQLDPNDAAELDGVAVVQNQRVWERYHDAREGFRLRDQDFLNRLSRHSRFSFDSSKLREPFNRPALIITGRQDHMVGYKDQWDILENYPRAAFAVLDRAGHGLYIEQQTLFNALVTEWLDRIEETLNDAIK